MAKAELIRPIVPIEEWLYIFNMSLPKGIVRYCCEDISLIENYHQALESNETFDVHHRLELDTGVYISSKELRDKDMYYNRPASELILLPHSVHTKMHAMFGFPNRNENISKARMGHKTSYETRQKIKNSRLLHNSKLTEDEWKKEYYRSEEAKRKISESNKGKKHRPISEEAKRKISEKMIKKWSDPEYKKKLSKSISDGVKRSYTEEHKQRIKIANTGRKMSNEFKENCRQRQLGKKLSVETRKKMSEASRHISGTVGFHWYTNGINNISCKECPPGYYRGRTIINKISNETRRKMSESQKQRQQEIRNGKGRID